jgi:broad specificity phosphatase PhoE
MATVYLIRHGQASFGSDDYDRLSELGCRQAVVLGEYLEQCGIVFDAVYSGELLRQRDTAELACERQPGELDLRIDARFNEIDNDAQLKYLVPEVVKTNKQVQELMERGLKASKDYQKVIDAVFNYWVSPECRETRIQSWEAYSRDVREALKDVMREQGGGKTIGVFTSGGTIATAVAQVLGLTGAQTYQFYEPIFNCSVSQLFYSGTRVSLSYFNDRSFLQVLGNQRGENLVSYR